MSMYRTLLASILSVFSVVTGRPSSLRYGRSTEKPGFSGYGALEGMRSYKIGIIADLDKSSHDHGGVWVSYLREGHLHLELDKVNPYRSNISIEWDDTHTIKSGFAFNDRGMELSTLNKFNGKLLACDDRTGIIYELQRDSSQEVISMPWVILGNGNYSGAGFKCEWATVKDNFLYVGGNGREEYDTKDGKRLKIHRYVKKISPSGEVSHEDWSERYDKMANSLNIRPPGFIVHEAAGWSEILKKWMFMPRYVSTEEYDEEAVRYSASNVAFVADENFDSVQYQTIGKVKQTRSFSDFKWIPGTDDQLMIALKTLELDEEHKTYIMAFDIKGNVILQEERIAKHKYEGIEFL